MEFAALWAGEPRVILRVKVMRFFVGTCRFVVNIGGIRYYLGHSNYPTLAEAYKVAALDGLNKL